MKEFIRNHGDRIHGVLSCFDRMLFHGYFPIMSGWLWRMDALILICSNLKPFWLENFERVKDHAIVKKHERALQYLPSNIRKEDTARQLVVRRRIAESPHDLLVECKLVTGFSAYPEAA